MAKQLFSKPSLAACVAACLVAVSVSTAHAQTTLYWSGDGATQGGNGTWDTALTRWGTVFSGPYSTVWNNSNNATARFGGGTSGTATLGTNITVGGLWFDTTAYRINNSASTLSFGAPNNPITFNSVAAATISGQLGGSGNVALSTTNPATAGTLTLNGTSTGGWSGSTTINAGMTLALAESNQGGNSTSAITLNGGGITLTNANSTQGALNRVSNSAGITSNSGTVTYANTSGSGNTYAETLGSFNLNRGQANIALSQNMSGGGGNVQTLTLSALSRTASTSSIAYSGNAGLNTTTNRIAIGGASDGFVGPWATVGTAVANQTDYASITDVGGIKYVTAANIAATAENSGSWVAGANVTLSGATTLTATRTVNTLRYTGTAQNLTLGASNFNLETYGLLNGGSGALTVQNAVGGTGALTTPTGGGNLFVNTGNNVGVTVSAPVNDNGGAVTLVKDGTQTLTLSSTASNFSGGIVLNAGALTTTSDANLGIGGGVVVNGAASWNTSVGTARAITINDGGVLTLTGASNQIYSGVLSGAGALASNTSNVYNFTNAGNSLTGTVTISYGMNFANIGESSNAINIGNTNGNAGFGWTGGSRTLSQRVFTLNSAGSGFITSSGTNGGTGLVIQQNLAISGTAGARTLVLQGLNTDNNTFSGIIADGTSGGASVVGLTKTQAGIWAVNQQLQLLYGQHHGLWGHARLCQRRSGYHRSDQRHWWHAAMALRQHPGHFQPTDHGRGNLDLQHQRQQRHVR